jgi:hypothetical protein
LFPEKYVHSKSVQGRIKQKATIGASSRQLKAQKNKHYAHSRILFIYKSITLCSTIANERGAKTDDGTASIT